MEKKTLAGQQAEEDRFATDYLRKQRIRRYEQLYSRINNTPSRSLEEEINQDTLLAEEDKVRLKTFLAERLARK